jgi:hypothetical protein
MTDGKPFEWKLTPKTAQPIETPSSQTPSDTTPSNTEPEAVATPADVRPTDSPVIPPSWFGEPTTVLPVQSAGEPTRLLPTQPAPELASWEKPTEEVEEQPAANSWDRPTEEVEQQRSANTWDRPTEEVEEQESTNSWDQPTQAVETTPDAAPAFVPPGAFVPPLVVNRPAPPITPVGQQRAPLAEPYVPPTVYAPPTPAHPPFEHPLPPAAVQQPAPVAETPAVAPPLPERRSGRRSAAPGALTPYPPASRPAIEKESSPAAAAAPVAAAPAPAPIANVGPIATPERIDFDALFEDAAFQEYEDPSIVSQVASRRSERAPLSVGQQVLIWIAVALVAALAIILLFFFSTKVGLFADGIWQGVDAIRALRV